MLYHFFQFWQVSAMYYKGEQSSYIYGKTGKIDAETWGGT